MPLCRPPLLFGVFSFIITSEAKGMCYFTRSYIQTFPAHPSVLHGSCSSCACRLTPGGFWTVLLCTRIYLMSHSGFGRSFCRPGDIPCPSAVHLYCSVCSALSFPDLRQRECATSLEVIFRLILHIPQSSMAVAHHVHANLLLEACGLCYFVLESS